MTNKEIYMAVFEEDGIPDWWGVKVFLDREEAEEYAKKKNKDPYGDGDYDYDEDDGFCEGDPGYYVRTIEIPE